MRRSVILASALLATSLSSAYGISASDDFGDWLRKLPRYKNDGQFDPKNENYWIGVFTLGAPFMLFALISFACWFLCMCCYCCCFRRSKQSSTFGRFVTRATLIVACVFAIAGASLSIASNVQFHQTSSKLMNPLLNVTQEWATDVEDLRVLLPALNATGQAEQEIDSLYKLVNQTNVDGQNLQDTTDKFEFARLIAVSVIFGCAIIASAFGIGGAILLSKLLLFLGVFGLLILPFLWSMVGVLLPLDTLFADVCPVATSYLQNTTTTTGFQWADYYLLCEGTSPLNNATHFAQSRLTEAEGDLEEAIAHHAPQKDIDELQQWVWDLQNVTYILSDLDSCQDTSAAWDSFYGMLCVDVFNKTLWIMIGALISATFLSLAVCVGCWRHKIFEHEDMENQGYQQLDSY